MTQLNLFRTLTLATLSSVFYVSSCTVSKPVVPHENTSPAGADLTPASTSPLDQTKSQSEPPSSAIGSVPVNSVPVNSQNTQPQKAQATEEPARCLTFSFRHQATAAHQPGPDCIEHQNRVEIPEALRTGSFDLSQLCVRVDGLAVAFIRKENHLVLAGTPRSNSVVSVRGCPKGHNCKADCRVARDAVMEDLVGDSEMESDGYDANAAKKVQQSFSADLKRELAQLDEDDINSSWVATDLPEPTQAQACNRKLGKK